MQEDEDEDEEEADEVSVVMTSGAAASDGGQTSDGSHVT